METLEKTEATAQALSAVLADTYTTYVKAQSYHWNVTGPNFASLHSLFEEIYQDLAEAVDDVAERIRALGAFVPGSFGAFESQARVRHEAGAPKAEAMIKDLAAALEIVSTSADFARQKAAEAGDAGTEDLMVKRIGTQEKYAWMLKSHLA